ncbi:MAG: alpha/beta fold hydrolase [Gemmatimonadales bacterium]
MEHIVVRGLTTAVDVEGDGRSLLFIHGFPFDRTMWRHQIATLSEWQRIAPDLRGMGLSDAPAASYSIGDYADDLVGLLDTLEVETCVLCGLSMGGYIAFELLRRVPSRIEALVLVNSRAASETDEGRAGRDQMIDLVRASGTGQLAEQLIPKVLAASTLATMPQVVEQLRTMIAAASEEGVVGGLAALRDRQDSSELLRSISIPTLVIAGAEDQIVPVDEARRMAQATPRAVFTVISDAGHLTPLEQPVATNRVLSEFLAALP